MSKILLVDNYKYLEHFLRADFSTRGVEIVRVMGSDDYRALISYLNPSILVMDMSPRNYYQPGAIVQEIKESYPYLPVIVTSVFEAVREEPGIELADAFVLKDLDTVLLRDKIMEYLPNNGGYPI